MPGFFFELRRGPSILDGWVATAFLRQHPKEFTVESELVLSRNVNTSITTDLAQLPSANSTGLGFLTGRQPHSVHGFPSTRTAQHSGHVVSAGACDPAPRLAWEMFSARLSSCSAQAISSSGNP